MKTLSRETNTVTIATFWENHLLGKYNYDPPYQRKSVWSEEKKSFLIDSILQNFPIPPIFLHQKIDTTTGKTTYDVIDGKQRLSAIMQFIRNEIPSSSESDLAVSEDVAGVYFEDLDEKSLLPYKSHFWKYAIPIEYVDSEDHRIIDEIFDRLNRNGEPLKGQELRNSKYYDSNLWHAVVELSEQNFWQKRLKSLDAARMEDLEFISELLFEVLEGKPLSANQKILDQMYAKYSKDKEPLVSAKKRFSEVTSYLEALDLDFTKFKISGVSHLYGLWCLAHRCLEQKISESVVKAKLPAFFEMLRSRSLQNVNVSNYKDSMSSRTKSDSQRLLREASLLEYIKA